MLGEARPGGRRVRGRNPCTSSCAAAEHPSGQPLSTPSLPAPRSPSARRGRRDAGPGFLRGCRQVSRAWPCVGPSSARSGHLHIRAKFFQTLSSGSSWGLPPRPQAQLARGGSLPGLRRPGSREDCAARPTRLLPGAPEGPEGPGGQVAVAEVQAPREKAGRAGSRAAQPALPEAAGRETLLERRESAAASAAAFRRRPGLLVQGPQSKYLSWLPGGRVARPGWGRHPLPRPGLAALLPKPRASPLPPPFKGEC